MGAMRIDERLLGTTTSNAPFDCSNIYCYVYTTAIQFRVKIAIILKWGQRSAMNISRCNQVNKLDLNHSMANVFSYNCYFYRFFTWLTIPKKKSLLTFDVEIRSKVK